MLHKVTKEKTNVMSFLNDIKPRDTVIIVQSTHFEIDCLLFLIPALNTSFHKFQKA